MRGTTVSISVSLLAARPSVPPSATCSAHSVITAVNTQRSTRLAALTLSIVACVFARAQYRRDELLRLLWQGGRGAQQQQ